MIFLRWIALLSTVVSYRVWFPEVPPPLPIHFDYDWVLVALIGLYRGVGVGTAAGFGIGLLSNATNPDALGWGALLGALLGWSVGVLKERLFLEYLLSRWLVLWGVLLIIKILYLIVATGGDFGLWAASLWSGGLASAGLSATIGVAVSVLWDRAHPRLRGPIISGNAEADD